MPSHTRKAIDSTPTLRALAHDLKPVVTIAERGLTDGVLSELERALSDHELIKIKVAVADREARRALSQEAAEKTQARVISEVGKTLVLYRANPQAKPHLSNLQRDRSRRSTS